MRLAVYSVEQRRETREFALDIMRRLEEVEFLDATEGDDVVTLTFDNRDMALFDDPDMRFGRKFALTFGWSTGEVSQRRVCTVQTMKNEGTKLKIIGHPDLGFIDRGFLFMDFQRARGHSLPPPAPETILLPDIQTTDEETGVQIFGTIAQEKLRGGSFGAGDPNISDPAFFRFIATRVAEENGFRAADVVFMGEIPDHIPDFTDVGWSVGRSDLESPDESVTWHFILDVLAAQIDWNFSLDNGLLLFRPNDFVNDPPIELVANGMRGRYEGEFQREIFDHSLRVKADVLRLPAVVYARGYDFTTKQRLLEIANRLTAQRQVKVLAKGTTSLQAEGPEVRHITTDATTAARASEDANAEYRDSEKDQVEAECKVFGVPRVNAGNNVLLTLPSRTISGVYTIKEARHKIIQATEVYTTQYMLRRRVMERAGFTDPDVIEAKSRAQETELKLDPGGTWYLDYRDVNSIGGRGRRAPTNDPEAPPQKNIPQH